MSDQLSPLGKAACNWHHPVHAQVWCLFSNKVFENWQTKPNEKKTTGLKFFEKNIHAP